MTTVTMIDATGTEDMDDAITGTVATGTIIVVTGTTIAVTAGAIVTGTMVTERTDAMSAVTIGATKIMMRTASPATGATNAGTIAATGIERHQWTTPEDKDKVSKLKKIGLTPLYFLLLKKTIHKRVKKSLTNMITPKLCK